MARATTATTRTTAGQATEEGRQTTAELAFLARAMKAPALLDAAERLAERARTESWTHLEYLVACLQREVSARDSHGGEQRIRQARFPAVKTLEEIDAAHLRGMTRQQLAHLGTLDFIAAKENVVLLGPPGTGKTHIATGLAVRACQAGHRHTTAGPEKEGGGPVLPPRAGGHRASPARTRPARAVADPSESSTSHTITPS
ncbi:ATP-binding protein [Streptomyces sp. NPDC056534]|uniref:ATP-binding protein n=1 Tax=Streptomyces sp. NPDC056534 TaxID=3345857 RepID=UPI0036B0B24C